MNDLFTSPRTAAVPGSAGILPASGVAGILPAKKPTPRLLTTPSYSFTQEQAEDAFKRWGCNCGPSALATMLGLTPDDVVDHIPAFRSRRYTNPSMMFDALRSLGVQYRQFPCDPFSTPASFVRNGLVRIQWDGPWCAPGVPIAARYRKTHWVGAIEQRNAPMFPRRTSLWIFDVNGGWLTFEKWRREIVPEITAHVEGANGKWWPTHRLQFVGVHASACPEPRTSVSGQETAVQP